MIWPALLSLREALGPDAELMLVGGAVRDELLGRPHADWDVATALLPETVIHRARAAGLRTIPTGLQHGTVTVLIEDRPVEVTTFRSDGDYLDGRRPESVRLGVSLAEDLSRRDFTINAMAIPLGGGDLVDLHGGRADLEARIIRAVGDPLARFAEDGLRPLRACRFAAQLAFDVEARTLEAIPARLEVARKVSVERVFTELSKLVCGQDPGRGLRLLAATGLLDLWLPELAPMIGCGQNAHHRFDVWNHTLRTFEREPTGHPDLRWALLLHDVGKPASRTETGGEVHFYGHEGLSLELVEALFRRFKASRALMHQVLALVRHHGTHPTPEWTDAACRRFLKRLNDDGLTLDAWRAFRTADQWGKGWCDSEDPTGDPKGQAWWEATQADLAATQARLEALLRAVPPMSVRELALDGRAIMALAGRPGGPWLGELQARLLDAVLEDPQKNTPEFLTTMVREGLGS